MKIEKSAKNCFGKPTLPILICVFLLVVHVIDLLEYVTMSMSDFGRVLKFREITSKFEILEIDVAVQ